MPPVDRAQATWFEPSTRSARPIGLLSTAIPPTPSSKPAPDIVDVVSYSHGLAALAIVLVLLGCAKGAGTGASAAASGDAGGSDFRLASAPAPQHPAGPSLLAQNGQAFVQVLGADFPDRVDADEPFVVRTYLKVLGTIDGDWDMGLKLFSVPPKAMFEAAHAPMNGAYPTSRWKPGELLVDTTEIKHLKFAGTHRVVLAIEQRGMSLRVQDVPTGADLHQRYEVPLGTLVVE